MAINPENIDVITVDNLNPLQLAVNSFFAHTYLGVLGKSTLAELATFIAPYVASVGASGYVSPNGNVLPNPIANTVQFSLVGTGTFTWSGGSLTTTAPFNVVTSNGTIWAITVAVPIDLSTYAKKTDLTFKASVIPGKNLFDLSTTKPGFYVAWDEGILYPNATYSASAPIPVVSGKTYYLSGTTEQSAWFDANMNYISGVSTPTSARVAPSSAKYAMLSMLTTQASSVQFEADQATGYAPYELSLANNIGFKLIDDTKEVYNLPTTPVITKSTPVNNTDMLGSIGMKLAANNINVNVISIPFTTDRAATETIDQSQILCAYLYVRNDTTILEKHYKKYVGGKDYNFELKNTYNPSTSSVIIQVGVCTADFKTVRSSIPVSNTNVDANRSGNILYLQADGTRVDIGSTLNSASSDYAGFNYSMYYVSGDIVRKLEDNPTKFEFLLPTLYICGGKQLWAYYDNFVKNSISVNKKAREVYFEPNVANSHTLLPDKIILNGVSNTGKMHLLEYNNGAKTTLLSKVMNINSVPTPTGKTINTLVIGDSFFAYGNLYGDGIQEYMKQFASTDGNSFVFKGTRTNANNPNPSEARGGWSELDFATLYVPIAQRNPTADTEAKKMPSPFVFSSNDTIQSSYFSFSQYLSTNSITNVDNVVFFLGMNGGDGTYINTMITNIKSTLPNVKIFVCMIPTAPLTGYSGTDAYAAILDRENQNKSYLAKFDNRASEKVYLVPSHLNVHNLMGIQNQVVNKYQFAELNAETQIINTGIHPTALGAKSIGYSVYNYLAYFS